MKENKKKLTAEALEFTLIKKVKGLRIIILLMKSYLKWNLLPHLLSCSKY